MCTQCGYDFQGDPAHAQCPKCGTSTQVWFEDGRKRIANAFPGTATAVSNHPGGRLEVVTGSWSHRSITRTAATGEVSHEYTGRPARGEIDALEACERLMEALKATGGVTLKRKFRVPEGREHGIDATADTVAGDVINVQVVNACDPSVLAEWGATGKASSSKTGAQLADDICTQVEKKRTMCPERDRNNIVLLVDAIRSPAHTTPPVIAMLRQPPRSDYLASMGYREVWLAGANNDLTFRLDESTDAM